MGQFCSRGCADVLGECAGEAIHAALVKDKVITDKEFGYPHTFIATRANVARMGEVRADDVFVCTYPKCGTNWVKQIVHSLATQGDPGKVKAEEEIDLCDLCPYLEADPSVDHDNLPGPRCYHTHVRYDDLPVGGRKIYVMRDMPDFVNSLFQFQKGFIPENCDFGGTPDFQAKLATQGRDFGGRWDKHIGSYWKERHRSDILFLKYEDLKKDLGGQIRRIAAFLEMSLDEDALARVKELSSFEWMKRNEHRIMGKQYLARLHGEEPQGKNYTLVHEGKVGHSDKFTQHSLAKMDAFWTEHMQPLLGSPSYAEFIVDGVAPMDEVIAGA